MRYRMDLSYIGAPFQGWQSQTNNQGIQDYVEKALATILRHPTRLNGAARTDSGVHALHQVATFETDAKYDEKRWVNSLNALIPREIGIISIVPVEQDFNAISSVKAKAYQYKLWIGPSRNPFMEMVSWRLEQKPNLELMASESQRLVGTHDFSAFCAIGSSAKTKVRTIFELQLIQKTPTLVEIWVLGDGFLKQMVRTIVGTLVMIGRGKIAQGKLKGILEGRNRQAAGETAPAQGLCLVRLFYDSVPSLKNVIDDRSNLMF